MQDFALAHAFAVKTTCSPAATYSNRTDPFTSFSRYQRDFTSMCLDRVCMTGLPASSLPMLWLTYTFVAPEVSVSTPNNRVASHRKDVLKYRLHCLPTRTPVRLSENIRYQWDMFVDANKDNVNVNIVFIFNENDLRKYTAQV